MALGCVALLAAGGVWLALALFAGGVPRALGLRGAPELVAQTDASTPAQGITLFGASPAEEEGELWGLAPAAGGSRLVRYSPTGGWTFGAPLQQASGEPLGGFSLDTPEAFREHTPSPLAAQITSSGAGAMLGSVGSGASSRQALLVRDPGGPFAEVAVPEGGEGLQPGESLFGLNSPPLLAALAEPGAKAGALVAPVGEPAPNAVLHWDGTEWHREQIELPGGTTQFEVLALAAATPEDAWLLGRSGGAEGALSLYRRHDGATPVWRPVATRAGGEPGAPLEIAGETLDEPGRDQAQLLTVTSAGVWLNARLHAARAPATLYFAPEGEADSGSFTGLWCRIPASSPGATPQAGEECSQHDLPELPTDYSRSFAWAGSGGYGERLITGLADGRMLRLEGASFHPVDTLGSRQHPEESPGATYGAAFTNPADGWLGKRLLPVHITPPGGAIPSKLHPWPVPFRFALTALAPQPGAPVGAEGSEVLAVGDHGEVARYRAGSGWLPETLPGPGGKRQAPRLRAVAWPRPARAYAVGDSEHGAGQMWLWRGETGLWEQDPAIPENFRGNLLGIAFDPNNSSRGYAVGQQGVLLSYGKSWVQEEEQNIPPAARGANFTGIAFAGSEAIVVWRKLIQQGQDRYAGGVIVNNGSGWREYEAADAVLGTNAVPWAVAGLADGGAAFAAESSSGADAAIYERSGAGAPWQGVAYPGGVAPGALTLFRENGALRAIGTSTEPDTFTAEEEVAPPPGFPPILVDPYPLATDLYQGVLRQTASGWSDEEHELNDAREPPGGYFFFDTPKIPDPVNAVLVDSAGAQGWAVGGVVNSEDPLLDTADIDRYPSASAPALDARTPETTRSGFVSVALGGGAACAAPCASRAGTGIGPEVWLHRAIEQTEEMGSVGAFVYTGPGVTTGQLAGPRLFPVPWQEEEEHYAERVTPESERVGVCTAPAPSDREGNGEGSAVFYEAAFGGGPECRGQVSAGEDFEKAGLSYSFRKEGLTVIVLDTSFVQGGQRELAPGELEFLSSRLGEAGGHAIVVGNADLPAEYAQGRGAARQLVAAIEAGDAAAYLFDAPEQNVAETLTGSPSATPAYGSGTLGYVNVAGEVRGNGFIGQSGFLVAEVSATDKSKANPNRYAVNVKLVPNIEELAVEAEQGTLLRRSQAASFSGLARRPRAGNRSRNTEVQFETAPYVKIPANCVGAGCARGIEPEFRFKSSDPHYGQFVERNLASSEPVVHDANGNAIPDEPGGKSGLFCAYNATPPGKPVYVTLETGNLSYTLPVTIQAGSVRQPCGTVPLAAKPAVAEPAVTPPPVSQPPVSPNPAPTSFSVPVPSSPAPAAPPAAAPSHPLVNQFLPQAAPVAFIPAFVPVPLPTPARPTPPSGTSAVEAAQKEEEEEAAPESVDAAASAYHQSEHELPPAYLLGLVVLAAFAGASLRGRRGPRRGTRVAPATLSTSRTQRRYEREARRRMR